MVQPKSTLTIITESLPTFFVGVPVNFKIQASGGQPPYTFRLGRKVLPAGLTLKSNGTISGVATKATNTTVDIKLTDAARPQASITQTFTVDVEAKTKTASG